MTYKLLVLDIDGTLVGTDRRVSAKNREAVAQARALGLQVSLCTGRSLAACIDIICQLSLDSYHVCFDGALVSSADLSEQVYLRPIPSEVITEMVSFTRSQGLGLELFSTTHYFAERETWSTRAHSDFFGVNATLVSFDGLQEREVIIKGGLVTTSTDEEALVKDFCLRFDGDMHLSQARTPAYPGVTFGNILARGVSKGNALTALTAHLGIKPDEVIAIGDGHNDLSLLLAAGLAIAMGNAPDNVKAVADHITLDVDRDGLAAAIHRFLM